MKKTLYILIFTLVSSNILSQNNIDTIIRNVNELQLLRLKNIFSDSRDSIYAEFDTSIIKLFQYNDFCNYRIDSSYQFFLNSASLVDDSSITLTYALINNIVYTTSQDNKLRIFSWDNLEGGSYHTYENFIQFNNNKNHCEIIQLDTLESDPEVGYYKIFQISDNENIYYLLFGHGTYGGGQHHKIIKILTIKNQKIVECFDFYPNSDRLLIFSNRAQEIGLKYNEQKKEIIFKQYKFDDDIGFYTNDFDLIKYELKNNKLIKE